MDAVLIANACGKQRLQCTYSSEVHCHPRKLGNRGRSPPHGCCPHSHAEHIGAAKYMWSCLQEQARLQEPRRLCWAHQGLPVVVPPGKALCDKLLGCEALHQLDDLEVGHSRDLRMLL